MPESGGVTVEITASSVIRYDPYVLPSPSAAGIHHAPLASQGVVMVGKVLAVRTMFFLPTGPKPIGYQIAIRSTGS